MLRHLEWNLNKEKKYSAFISCQVNIKAVSYLWPSIYILKIFRKKNLRKYFHYSLEIIKTMNVSLYQLLRIRYLLNAIRLAYRYLVWYWHGRLKLVYIEMMP